VAKVRDLERNTKNPRKDGSKQPVKKPFLSTSLQCLKLVFCYIVVKSLAEYGGLPVFPATWEAKVGEIAQAKT
jgi:hypothetical protein